MSTPDFLFEAFNLVKVVFWALFAIFDLDFNQFKSSNSLCQYFLTTIMCFVIELKSEIHPLLLLFATISKSVSTGIQHFLPEGLAPISDTNLLFSPCNKAGSTTKHLVRGSKQRVILLFFLSSLVCFSLHN